MELFHTLNRGVDKRKIFLDNQDYFRFIHDLYEFNDQDRVNSALYYFNQTHDIASREMYRRKARKLLVDIHCFCIMPNHYHLLLSPRVDNGITKFMKKLNMGYAKYFNQKYDRTGALFEGRYKSVQIKDQSHFIHIPYYIHLNPLDLIDKGWRNRRVADPKQSLKFLNNYRWSSYLDYIGNKNFPSITSRTFLSEFLGGERNYKTETINWIKNMDLGLMGKFLLE